MNLLLDTHVFLWWLDDNPRLGPIARRHITSPGNDIWISAASAWEIAIKAGLGRLELGEPPEECLPREIENGGFRHLDITMRHALAVRTLPRHHADPFDRLLVAQAQQEGFQIITSDGAIRNYDVATLPADA